MTTLTRAQFSDPAAHGIAKRLRDAREAERFSQSELAAEVEITRAALASFEAQRNPLPFTAGWAICRRLNICPRWLVTGQEPRYGCPSAEELGIDADELRAWMRRGKHFVNAYADALSGPLDAWLHKNSAATMIAREFEAMSRRLTREELLSRFQEIARVIFRQ